ncbi:MAG: anthranilate synthase component I family protein, partial [Trueperaceae bacterium]
PKERAEHVMLVDLGRNDLGRVCRAGSVRVTDLMSVERYSHVMHIVSRVEGELAEGRTALDALAATLPMGTASGAPKVRAMEIIDELEPVRRGPYAGAFGYLAVGGDMDMALTLRTMVVAGGRLHLQAGGGVVADSDPELEYQESLNKLAALRRAVELAAEGLA